MIVVSICLPSDGLSQCLLRLTWVSLTLDVSLHGCSSKAQALLLTLEVGQLLSVAAPHLGRGVAPLHRTSAPSVAAAALLNITLCTVKLLEENIDRTLFT